MKQECLLCERTAPDNNLYCQEIYCPAEMSPTILDYGDWLGNIEIVKPLIALRHSVLYEARCQKKKVLLKVAHPGIENRERLKREAQFLKSLQQSKASSEYLPVWLSPYLNPKDEDAYGKIVLRGHLLYYCLFDFFVGEPLRAVLIKIPQLWVYHIGWIMVRLATAVAILQSKGLYHFGLSPDALLLNYGDGSDAPAILLFDLGVVAGHDNLGSSWHPFFIPPAYAAPELVDALTPQPDYATDVYGLGLILYELLVGQPSFPYKLHGDEEVYDAIRQNHRVSMTRYEDVRAAADIAIRAVNPNPTLRYSSAAELVKHLHVAFGAVPEKRRPMRLVVILLVVGAIVAIAMLVVIANF